MSDTLGIPPLDLAAVRAALDARCGQPARIRTHWADCHLFAGHELCLAFRLLHECDGLHKAIDAALASLEAIPMPESFPLGAEVRIGDAVRLLRTTVGGEGRAK